MRQYEFTPLAQVQGWAGLSQGEALFDSLIVFQNAPSASLSPSSSDAGELQPSKLHFRGGWTNYPLALDVKPSRELILNLSFNQSLYSSVSAQRLLSGMALLLNGYSQNPETSLTAMLSALAEAEQRLSSDQAQNAEAVSLHKLGVVRRKAIPRPIA